MPHKFIDAVRLILPKAKLDYIKNVSSKLINTTCSPTENFKTAYKINQITMLDAENSEEINEDDIVIKQQEEKNND